MLCSLLQMWSLKWKWKLLSCVQLFLTPWTVTRHAPLSMEFSSKNIGVDCHSPRDLPHPGTELMSPALQADSLLSEGKQVTFPCLSSDSHLWKRVAAIVLDKLSVFKFKTFGYIEPSCFYHVVVAVVFRHWVISDSFVTPWTVAHQAPLSMRIFQARILQWVAITFSRGSSWPRNWTCTSCFGRRILYHWATREAVLLS